MLTVHNSVVTEITGTLEIDHKRGVIYFHVTDPEDAKIFGLITLMRIQNNRTINTPIGSMIDLSIPAPLFNKNPGDFM